MQEKQSRNLEAWRHLLPGLGVTGLVLTKLDLVQPEKQLPCFSAFLGLRCTNYAHDSAEGLKRLSSQARFAEPLPWNPPQQAAEPRSTGQKREATLKQQHPNTEQSACRGCSSRTPLRGAVACTADAKESAQTPKRGTGPLLMKLQEEAGARQTKS